MAREPAAVQPGAARHVLRWISGRVLPPLAYPVLLGPLRGHRFVLRAAAGAGGGASVYLNKVEPEQTSTLVQVLRPGDVFFDVGANVGYYTLLGAARIGPRGRVLAFEPSPRNLAYLHRHLALNRVRNVTVITAACAERSGVRLFAEGPDCARGHLVDEQPGSECAKLAIVPTVTLDQVVAESGVRPRVIKIDVEGAEQLVLRGAMDSLSTDRPTLLLSVHSAALAEGCATILRELGYAITRISGPDEHGGLEWLCVPDPARSRGQSS